MLPNPNKFKNHTLELVKSEHHSSYSATTNDIDLNDYHTNLLKAKEQQQNLAMGNDTITNPTILLYELFNMKLLRSFDNSISAIFNKYIGYSKKYKSLTISLIADDVKTITIRKATNKSNEIVKWKTYGSKKFIPTKINSDDKFIFLASGMSEFILFEMFEFSYILLQSDGMYRNISKETIGQCKDKTIVILADNDDTFKSIIPPLKEMFNLLKMIVIDFEKVLNKKLLKGYDFRDFCNEINNKKEILKILENEIIKGLKDV